jgi:hypothetical protein
MLKRLSKKMSLHELACNLKRAIATMEPGPLLEAMRP